MTNPKTEHYLGLSGAHHYELTVDSLIAPGIIRDRLYQTVKAHKLPPQFADYQRREGLVIPIYNVNGDLASFQLKPDQPRISKNGKPIKYETAANAPQVLDVPRSCTKMMSNPSIPLWITEGAKKVDSALSNGITCIIGLQGVYGWRGTNPDGGKTALPDWESIALNSREVIIAFDSDVMAKNTVRSALDRLSAFLHSRGARVKYVVMPNLPDGSKCGIDDWFASGRNRDELASLAVDELPVLSASKSDESRVTIRPVVFSMSEIEAKPINWLWPGWLPKGMLTLLGGYAGDGKSTITTSLIASLSNGTPLPDGTETSPTNSLMLVAEDDVSHVVKPRLEVHGADMDRVHVLHSLDANDGMPRSFNLRTDIPVLKQVVKERNIGLLVIDPLSSYLANGDRNNEGDVRDTLQPLVQMMEETGCAVIGIMHIGKNDGQAKAFQKLMGSTAFTALARSVWMVSNLPEDFQVEGEPTRKMLGVAKSNYAVAPSPIQFFRPQDAALEYLGNSPISLDQAFSWKPKSEKSSTETDKAEDWLLEYMDGKRVLASEVEAAAKAEGFGETTLRKAKKKLKVISSKELNKWYWLPPQDESIEVA